MTVINLIQHTWSYIVTVFNFICSISIIDAFSIIALILSLAGNLLINYKKRTGFIVWLLSNILWIAVNLLGKPNVSQIIMFIVYICFNVHGFLNWRKSTK